MVICGIIITVYIIYELYYKGGILMRKYPRGTERVTIARRLKWDGGRCITLREERIIGNNTIGEIKYAEFQLEPISREDLMIKRREGKPGIVLKKGEELYYSQITNRVKLTSLEELRYHKCGECCRLSAKPDYLGGCAKVRSIKMRIEYYNFIELGMETFNLPEEMLLVLKCQNYERD